MNSRERVRAVLAHKIPDRIPNGLGGCETGKATQLVCERIYEQCYGK